MDYYDLGTHSRPVTTTSPEAQTLVRPRAGLDVRASTTRRPSPASKPPRRPIPDCAMAYWGIAYALGPNYNKPWEFFDGEDLARTVDRTHAAVERAHEKAAGATPVERALIDALRARYPQAEAVEDCSVWNEPYADAHARRVRTRPRRPRRRHALRRRADEPHPVAAVGPAHRRAGRGRPHAGGEGGPGSGARRPTPGPTHPGVLHMYIHLMEMSPTPETALPVADRLRGLVPDAGHLQHMPTHLDVLCGDYRRVVSDNSTRDRRRREVPARGPAR